MRLLPWPLFALAPLALTLTAPAADETKPGKKPDDTGIAWKKTVLRALHRYGGYVGDTTGGNVSWGLQTVSGSTYTSFGKPDPMVGVAEGLRLRRSGGSYYLDMDSGVDWGRHLRVVDPCVAQGSC